MLIQDDKFLPACDDVKTVVDVICVKHDLVGETPLLDELFEVS